MKKYENPTLLLIALNNADVLTGSEEPSGQQDNIYYGKDDNL